MSPSVNPEGRSPTDPRQWLYYPLLNFLVSIRILFIDARFTYRMGIHASLPGRLLKFPAVAVERVSRRLKSATQDLIFRRFYRLHSLHYGPTGRGYHGMSLASHDDRMSRYLTQVSRLSYFAEEFSDILRYENGDTFADLGCGPGQNIHFLVETYPSSMVIGTDMNADALALVGECELSPNVQLSIGDMRDQEFLSSILSRPIDHVVMSHVFSLIFGQSAFETRALRENLINHVVERSRKSVIILDSFGKRGELTVAIEQRQRAQVTDDVMSYFGKYSYGRVFMVQSAESQAVIFSRTT